MYYLMSILVLQSSYRCIVTITVMWLFFTAQWVGLQCVIVVFPDHTHLLFLLNLFLNCASAVDDIAYFSTSLRVIFQILHTLPEFLCPSGNSSLRYSIVSV